MRTILTFYMAIVFLLALANARIGDSADGKRGTAAVPSAADVLAFQSGLWEAIALGNDFDDIAPCVKEDNDTGDQLQKAMSLMNSSSDKDVKQGLNKLQKVAAPLLKALKDCALKDEFSVTTNQIVQSFTASSKVAMKPGASLSVEGVEVKADNNAAITACSNGKFSECGEAIGNAMGKVFYGQEPVTSAAQAAKLNAIPGITWTAANTPEFSGMNLWQFKKQRLTVRNKKIKGLPIVGDEGKRSLLVIPSSFDSRTKWPGCIHPIRNQKSCGSCWAFGAAEALEDRFCIASKKSINKVMSVQRLLSCETKSHGCGGGYLYYAWKFLEKSGDFTETCWPYQSGNGVVPACSSFTKCFDKAALRRYYVKVNSTKSFATATAIQTEILTYGPIEAAFSVYSDFMSYKSGIYAKTAAAKYVGGHAVKIIGWGKSNGVKYWLAANSWGTSWGSSGFFKIKFGNCNIDKYGMAGRVDLVRK